MKKLGNNHAELKKSVAYKKSMYIYQNELDKACFDHYAACCDCKDLAKRTISDKISKDRAYKIAINPKYNGYQRGLASMVKKMSVNKLLAQELHKPVVNKFKRRKVCARFKGNIRTADLAGMGSLSSFNCGVKYLVYLIDDFTKYTSVKPLKDKKTKTFLRGLVEIVNEFKRQPNKIWIDQGREFYNNLMQKWLDDNEISLHLTHNIGQ